MADQLSTHLRRSCPRGGRCAHGCPAWVRCLGERRRMAGSLPVASPAEDELRRRGPAVVRREVDDAP